MEFVSHYGGFAALSVIAVGYVLSVVRNWRPLKPLREENDQLRALNASLQEKLRDLEAKFVDLEHRYAALEKSRDFQAAFEPLARAIDQARGDASHEHERWMRAFSDHEAHSEKAWAEITRGLAANTAVLGVLAAGLNPETITQEEK